MERSKTIILNWLINDCHIDDDRARYLEEQIREKCCVTSVESLQVILLESPDALDGIEFPLCTKRYLIKSICSFNCKSLLFLSTLDVKELFNLFYPGEKYGNVALNYKLNGIVLYYVDDAEKLLSFGISDRIHADALFKKIQNWKFYGVPLNLLNIQQEKHTSSSSSTEPSLTLHGGLREERDDAFDFGVSNDELTDQTNTGNDLPIPTRQRRGSEDTDSEVGSLHQQQTKTNSITSSREQATISSQVSTTINTLPSSFSSSAVPQSAHAVSSSSSSSRTRPERAVVKPDRFEAEPALCAKRRKPSETVQQEGEEENSEVKPNKHKRLSYKDDEIPESPFQSPLSNEELQLMIKEQADIISSPLSDTHCLQESVLTLFYIIENRPDSTGLMQNSGVYRTILELLRLIDDEELLYRVMLVLSKTTECSDTSVVRYLVEGEVVSLTLPHCHSARTRLRLRVLEMIGNIGASELKGEVTTLEVVQAVAQSYCSSEARISHRYACTLQILTKDCSQQQARMMIPFIPVLKRILQTECLLEGVQCACSALSNFLISQEETIVDVILNDDSGTSIIKELVHQLQDSRVKVVKTVVRLLIEITDCCNCDQVLLLQPALQFLFRIIQKRYEDSGYKEAAILAIECFGSITKLGAGAVSMLVRTTPELFETLVGLVQEGLQEMKLSAFREHAFVFSATTTLMSAVSSAAEGGDILYFIELRCYPLVFAVLEAFNDNDEIVQETVSALTNVIRWFPNFDHQQKVKIRINSFEAPAGWAVLQGLANKGREPSSTHNCSALQMKNSVNAQKLLQIAIQLRLTEEKG